MTVEADITVGVLLSSMANAGNSGLHDLRGDEPVECLKLVEYAEDLGLTVVCAGKGKNNPNRITGARGQRRRGRTQEDEPTHAQRVHRRHQDPAGDDGAIERHESPDRRRWHARPDPARRTGREADPEQDGGILREGPGRRLRDRRCRPRHLRCRKVGTRGRHRGARLPQVRYRPLLPVLPAVAHGLDRGASVDQRGRLDRRSDFQSRTSAPRSRDARSSTLKAGITLEGMGGHHFDGWAIPAEKAREIKGVPIGLLQHSKLKVAKKQDEIITYDDLEIDETRPIVAMRRLQDAMVARGVIWRLIGAAAPRNAGGARMNWVRAPPPFLPQLAIAGPRFRANGSQL